MTSGRCRRCWGTALKTTTMLYTHVMNRPSVAVTSPLDRLILPVQKCAVVRRRCGGGEELADCDGRQIDGAAGAIETGEVSGEADLSLVR